MYQYTFRIGNQYVNLYDRIEKTKIDASAAEKIITGFIEKKCTQIVVSAYRDVVFDPKTSIVNAFPEQFIEAVKAKIHRNWSRTDIQIVYLIPFPEFDIATSISYMLRLKATMDVFWCRINKIGGPKCGKWFDNIDKVAVNPSPTVRGTFELEWNGYKPNPFPSEHFDPLIVENIGKAVAATIRAEIWYLFTRPYAGQLEVEGQGRIAYDREMGVNCIVHFGGNPHAAGVYNTIPTILQVENDNFGKFEKFLRKMKRTIIKAPDGTVYDVLIDSFVFHYGKINGGNIKPYTVKNVDDLYSCVRYFQQEMYHEQERVNDFAEKYYKKIYF